MAIKKTSKKQSKRPAKTQVAKAKARAEAKAKKKSENKLPKGLERVNRKQASKRKVDWTAAYNFYLEDAKRSYSDVAKEFGVVKKTVEQNATVTYVGEDGAKLWCTWAERRQMLGEIAKKKAEEAYLKSAGVRSEKHLEQYRLLQEASTKKIATIEGEGKIFTDEKGNKVKLQMTDARQLADVAKALKIATDGERVIMGLPTSVSTIKPGADDETGKGWGELLALALRESGASGEQSES